MPAKYLSRQDIAQMLEMSTDCVRRNEPQLGTLPAKVVINARKIKYREAEVLEALRAKGLILAEGPP